MCLQNTTIHIQKTKFYINQSYVIKHLNVLYIKKKYTPVFTKHYIKKTSSCVLKILNYKPVYTTLCLYTKKYQRSSCVYKTLRFISKKHPHVFSQILNHKTCLYNFVSLHKKIPKIPMCLQNTTIHIQKRS